MTRVGPDLTFGCSMGDTDASVSKEPVSMSASLGSICVFAWLLLSISVEASGLDPEPN